MTKSRVTSWQHVTTHLLPQIEERMLLESRGQYLAFELFFQGSIFGLWTVVCVLFFQVERDSLVGFVDLKKKRQTKTQKKIQLFCHHFYQGIYRLNWHWYAVPIVWELLLQNCSFWNVFFSYLQISSLHVVQFYLQNSTKRKREEEEVICLLNETKKNERRNRLCSFLISSPVRYRYLGDDDSYELFSPTTSTARLSFRECVFTVAWV